MANNDATTTTTSTADRLAKAVVDVLDAHREALNIEGVFNLRERLREYDAALVERVIEIVLSVHQVDKSLRLSHWHVPFAGTTDAVSGPLPSKQDCPYCGGAFACPIHDTNPADAKL